MFSNNRQVIDRIHPCLNRQTMALPFREIGVTLQSVKTNYTEKRAPYEKEKVFLIRNLLSLRNVFVYNICLLHTANLSRLWRSYS